jgi:hypothetical protein
MATPLILTRANVSRSSGQWREDDYDVLENGVVVGRIFMVPTAPEGRPWMWASGHSADSVKRGAHGYESTREAARAARACPKNDASGIRSAFVCRANFFDCHALRGRRIRRSRKPGARRMDSTYLLS